MSGAEWRGRRLPGYREERRFGYSLGSFATVELLRWRPAAVRRVVLGSRCPEAARARIGELSRAAGVTPEQDAGTIASVAHRRDVDALAVFEKYQDGLDPQATHLALVTPRDPGNLGAIMRSQVAFEFLDLALIGDAVDHFSPHVVRASIGAAFRVRVARYRDIGEYQERFPRPLYPFTGDARTPLAELELADPATMVFGPEWPGLPGELRRLGHTVAIPHSSEVESLNLAVAVGIALYVARHRRCS